MMQMITCDYCKGKYSFTSFTFTPAFYEKCKHCKDVEQIRWTYSFCGLKCFTQWMIDNQIEERGFPCRTCMDYKTREPTGVGARFVDGSTKPCHICNGLKYIKETIYPEWWGKIPTE